MAAKQQSKISLRQARIEAGLSVNDLVKAVNDAYRDTFGKDILSLSTLKAVEKDKTRVRTKTANAIIQILNKYRVAFGKSKVTIFSLDWRVQDYSDMSQAKKEAIDKMRAANPKVKKG